MKHYRISVSSGSVDYWSVAQVRMREARSDPLPARAPAAAGGNHAPPQHERRDKEPFAAAAAAAAGDMPSSGRIPRAAAGDGSPPLQASASQGGPSPGSSLRARAGGTGVAAPCASRPPAASARETNGTRLQRVKAARACAVSAAQRRVVREDPKRAARAARRWHQHHPADAARTAARCCGHSSKTCRCGNQASFQDLRPGRTFTASRSWIDGFYRFIDPGVDVDCAAKRGRGKLEGPCRIKNAQWHAKNILE